MSTVAATNTEETKVVGTEPAPDTTDEEPQNSLTQKFTDKEWAALKEFRVRATEGATCNLLTATSASPPRHP
jgi:hypothetical protein